MKALLNYLVLVGLPVLGVLGVLQLGQGLTAPKALAGAWTFVPSSFSPEASACPVTTSVTQIDTLTVAQSGPKLTLKLGELRVDGQVDGSTVRATSPLFTLDADVGSPELMRGTLTFPTCPASPVLAFSALRQLRGQERG